HGRRGRRALRDRRAGGPRCARAAGGEGARARGRALAAREDAGVVRRRGAPAAQTALAREAEETGGAGGGAGVRSISARVAPRRKASGGARCAAFGDRATAG